MPTINRLSAIDALAGGDLLPVYDASNSDARKASLTALDTYLTGSLAGVFAPKFIKQEANLTATGQTITLTDSGDSVWLIVKPAAAYAAATLTLPAVGNCVDGQEVIIHCKNTITTFTVSGNGATLYGCTIATFTAGTRHVLRFNATDTTWYGDVAV